MKIICIGDMGKGGGGQRSVSALIESLMNKYHISFVTGLGDNIYPSGCKNIKDRQFISKFENPYRNIPNNIPWHMILGNHDYGYGPWVGDVRTLIDNSQAQLDYHNYSIKKGLKWRMPAKYYQYGRGNIEIFALDTNFDRLNKEEIRTQKRIMKDKIKSSNKRWKIVVGHHTWRSIAGHGNAEFPELESFLSELARETDIDAYMCGHDHCKSLVIKRVGGRDLPIIVCGTGGETYDYNVYPKNMKIDNSKLYFFSPHLGVCLLDVTSKRLIYNFYNTKGEIEYSYKYEK